MKILIINPEIRLTDKPRHIPHGLAILANIIRKELGIEPTFLDINANRYSREEIYQRISSLDFDTVLIGGLIPVYKRIIDYAAMIKEINSNAIIIAGGSAAMSVPELLLDNSQVDAVCAGEGEEAIVELLDGLRANKLAGLGNVRGFYFKKDGEILHSGNRELLSDLDSESDLPAYDLVPMEIYLSNPAVGFGRDVDFISSRGCPFNCTFCYQPWGRKFRAHSVDYIIDALKNLRDEYRIDFVSFQDDEFMANVSRVGEFCEKVVKGVPGLLWSCTGRADIVKDETVGMMRDAGCVAISYGFESGSPRILTSMNKRVTVDQMENAVRINRKYGLMLPVSFIIGMPGEDETSCRETVEFCVRNEIPLKSMMFATPYPGTKLYEDAIASGKIDSSKLHEYVMKLEDARDFVVNLTDAFTDDQLKRKRDGMIEEVCDRVRPLPEEVYGAKLKKLFGSLVGNYGCDDALLKHRAEHSGLDVF